jgi:hypothetical protein
MPGGKTQTKRCCAGLKFAVGDEAVAPGDGEVDPDTVAGLSPE